MNPVRGAYLKTTYFYVQVMCYLSDSCDYIMYIQFLIPA